MAHGRRRGRELIRKRERRALGRSGLYLDDLGRDVRRRGAATSTTQEQRDLPRLAQNPSIPPFRGTTPEHVTRSSFSKLLLLTLFFLTIVLDFRKVEGDTNPIVMIMGIANVLLGVWYCVTYRHFTARLFWWAGAFLMLAGVGTLTAILYGRDLYRIFSSAVPIFSFALAAIAVHSLSGDGEKGAAIRIILTAGIIALVVKFIWGFYYYERDLANVRYQIVSGSMPLLFAYSFATFFSRGPTFSAIAILIATATVAVLAVTRTYILVFALTAIVCFYSYSRADSRLVGILMTLVIGSTLAYALTEFFPQILGRWEYRITNAQEDGFDLTAASRLAEVQFQLERLWSDFAGLLFGFGHAAEIGLAGENKRLIAKLLFRSVFDTYNFGYGHNFYVGLLYVGGLVAGLPVIVTLFHLLANGLRHARRQSASAMDRFLLIWGLSAFAGYLGYGMLAGSFTDRSISFFFGVSAGLVLLGTEHARHAVSQLRGSCCEKDGDMSTPKQRRAAIARELAAGSRAPPSHL